MTFSGQCQCIFKSSMMLQSVDLRFERRYCFHLPGQAVQEQSCWAPRPCRHYDHYKRPQLRTSRYGVLSQKTWIFTSYQRCQKNQGICRLHIQGSPTTQECFEGASRLCLQDNPRFLVLPWKWITQHPGTITPIHTTTYEGWNFNFGNTPLDWIQELLEWRANEAGRMGPSPTYIHNGSGPSRNGHTQ